MIDAGSTGSRIHVYRFNYCSGRLPSLENEDFIQIKPGLSSYDSDADAAAQSLDSLLDKALKIVPPELQRCTPVAVKATAGLRLLGQEKSDRILKKIEDRLLTKYPFKLMPTNGVAVMDGADEGVFAWITVNYLLRRIGQAKKQPTAAIMDLGGGSTQIVFEPSTGVSMPDGEHKYVLPFGSHNYTLYQHSYLGYGLMEGRKKIIKASLHSTNPENPCLPSGHEEKVKVDSGDVVVRGSGSHSFSQCSQFVSESIFSKSTCTYDSCSFDGVYQPLLTSSFAQNDIYAFSYFYDRAEPLSMPADFKIKQFSSEAEKVCSGSTDVDEVRKEPRWCLDMVFIHSLLTLGYDLPAERDIKIAKKIDGVETGWCLGATIHMLDTMTKSSSGVCRD
ncbi:nucleoside phosphatase GDA1/CD39 [Polychytrium aggregatum]|uniref:nucleoside phosphatase GDA1/CD39 n=1 Tax=Polychytrium aggregatum TaxID=110093 RepID=UPI0022FE487C|nr:nucleoside phosphatase GDA1/CD39 [Polychytrium aggregatum]KAI9199687.1 nucleoside phosphatase GDA1/CD39 [Polychytrium aggregatum]